MTAGLRDIQERVLDIVIEALDKARELVSKRYGDKPNRQATVALDFVEHELKLKLDAHALLWRELAARYSTDNDEDVQ